MQRSKPYRSDSVHTGLRDALRCWLSIVAAHALACALAASVAFAQSRQVFTNGQWFDGTHFRRGDRYVVNGRFVAQRPRRLDTIVDLHGAFVVPPFAEAHTHNIEATRFDAVSRMYLERGIFYVKNPNSLPRFTAPLLGRINGPGLLDVAFATGGLTSTGGDATAIAARQIARGAWLASEGDGGFFWNVDRIADLDDKWPRILAERPDFIKTYAHPRNESIRVAIGAMRPYGFSSASHRTTAATAGCPSP